MIISETPLVSVVVPVYNTAMYLEQCIESVLCHTYDNWELILVDDGSTDESPLIIERYRQKDSRISTYQSNSACVSVARNKGISEAKGDYVYFIDSDDYITPDALRKLIEVAAAIPDADFIQGSFSVLNMKTEALVKASRFYKLRLFNNLKVSGEEFLTNCGSVVLYPFNSLIKTQFLRKHDIRFPSNVSVAEDTVFILTILLADSVAVYTDNNGLVYRYNRAGSLTTDNDNDERKKKTASSMIKAIAIMQRLNPRSKRARRIIDRLVISYVSGCIGAASILLPDRAIFDELRRTVKHVRVESFGIRQTLCALYNLSPKLALKTRNLLN